VGYLDAGEAAAEFSKAKTNLVFIGWQRRAVRIELAMANDLLYKASLHLGVSPQSKRGSLLHKLQTDGNIQQRP
jgi:hypothetical protein